MELKSLSASAIKVWELCPSRAGVQTINRPPQGPAAAADLGSAVHMCLEQYVEAVYLKKELAPDLGLLLKLYTEAYRSYFGSDMLKFQVGMDMVKKWFERTDFSDREVLSVEVKKFFEVPTSIGPVRFNYIFDRVDRIISTGDIEVVDYKSWVLPRQGDELQGDLQMRGYSLAAAIEFKSVAPPYIWVTLDQLRYDPIGTRFSREDNKEMWTHIQKIAEEIIVADVNNLKEKLNSECRFCIRRHKCDTLKAHAAVGGPLAIDDHEEATRTLAEIQYQISGLQAIEVDLQKFLLDYAHEHGDIDTWDVGDAIGTISFQMRRNVDADKIRDIVPPSIFARYGGVTVKAIEAMLTDPEMTPELKAAVNRAIARKPTNPTVKAKIKGGLHG